MDQDASKVKRLSVCNNRWSFPVDGFSAKYLHAFFVLVKLLNCWMKIVNIGNVICVSFMAIFQQVIAVYMADLSEFIID